MTESVFVRFCFIKTGSEAPRNNKTIQTQPRDKGVADCTISLISIGTNAQSGTQVTQINVFSTVVPLQCHLHLCGVGHITIAIIQFTNTLAAIFTDVKQRLRKLTILLKCNINKINTCCVIHKTKHSS